MMGCSVTSNGDDRRRATQADHFPLVIERERDRLLQMEREGDRLLQTERWTKLGLLFLLGGKIVIMGNELLILNPFPKKFG